MLKTFALRGREMPLTVYGPPGLRELFGHLRRVFGKVPYPLETIEVRPGEALERDGYRMLVFPVATASPRSATPSRSPTVPGEFDAEAAGCPRGARSGPSAARCSAASR